MVHRQVQQSAAAVLPRGSSGSHVVLASCSAAVAFARWRTGHSKQGGQEYASSFWFLRGGGTKLTNFGIPSIPHAITHAN